MIAQQLRAPTLTGAKLHAGRRPGRALVTVLAADRNASGSPLVGLRCCEHLA